MSKRFTTLNDTPHIDEEFYKPFIEDLSKEVRFSTPPKTLAITGYWGSGKTSALAQLFKDLTGKYPPSISPPERYLNEDENTEAPPKYVGVWFEAWRYQNEEQPIVSLLHAIKEEFTWLQSLPGQTKKIVDLSILGSLAVLDSAMKVATGLKTNFKNLKKQAEQYEKDNLLATLPTDKIHLALKQAIDVLLQAQMETYGRSGETSDPSKKMLIFIDDLDRCQPQAALKLLEGLKLYLNIPNCVIVMGIDQAQLEHAVGSELGDSPNKHFIGVEYLEKLCQDAHRLPLMTQEKGAALITAQLNELLTCKDSSEYNIARANLVSQIEGIITSTRCLPANPRRIKMVINRLLRYVDYEVRQHRLPANEDTEVDEHSASDNHSGDSVSAPLTFNLDNGDAVNISLAFKVKAMVFLACLYVSYRQIYEQLEWNIDFFDDLQHFANPDEHIDEKNLINSPFEGFRQPSPQNTFFGEPPSDLSVLRPIYIIYDIQNIDKEFKDKMVELQSQAQGIPDETALKENLRLKKQAAFKAVLKQLIHNYNR